MGGRKWTDEDLQKLDEMIGSYPVSTIAKSLGRSFDSVNIKMNRLGYQGFTKSTDLLTVNHIAKMFNVDNKTVYYWNRLGLKVIKKGKFRVVRQEDLINFMKENQMLWSSLRGDMYLLEPFEWFREKKRVDKEKQTKAGDNWTTLDENRLLMYRKKGYTYNRCAKELNRTLPGIKCKLNEIYSKVNG